MSQADANAAPAVSIVIPIYNEEGILRGSVLELREKLRPFGFSYELLLCENGSRDRTVEIGKELEAEYPVVRMISPARRCLFVCLACMNASRKEASSA